MLGVPGQFPAALRNLWGAAQVLRTKCQPAVELIVRLCLAKPMFLTGVMGAMSASGAMLPAPGAPAVSWPSTLMGLAAASTLELVLGILLAAGLATRIVTALQIAMLIFGGSYLDQSSASLASLAVLSWITFQGAGALSLDAIFARGLASSAVPFARQTLALLSRFSFATRPICILLLRLWIAYLLLGAVGGPAPARDLSGLPAAAAWVGAIAITLGFLTSSAAIWLALMGLGGGLMFAHPLSTMYWPLSLLLLAAVGPGPISLEHLVRLMIRPIKHDAAGKPHVVVVGAGFGGLACVYRLRLKPVRVTLIDKRNFHLFQPLLYQVATASLSPGDIATPIRAVLREVDNVTVLYQTATGVDSKNKVLMTEQGSVAYDYLVLATGASHGYFGNSQWAKFAPGLKTLEDALAIRRRVLTAFEQAEHTPDANQRAALLTFVICGGGPTGVELAGALAELARNGLKGEFKTYDPASARIVLIQSGARLLPAFDERLSQAALASLQTLGVSVRLNTRVTSIDPLGVTFGTETLKAGLVIWAAGVVASPAARWLGQEADSAGRIKVKEDLSVADCPGVFAIGDTVLVSAWKGAPVPGLAQAAEQGGHYVAKRILREVAGMRSPGAFCYRHRGSLATIGRKSAVAQFGGVSISGPAAWWLWGALHLSFLVSGRNRLTVLLGWLWAYFTYGIGVQLITGDAEAAESKI